MGAALPAVKLGLTAASTGLATLGAYRGAQARQQQAEYQAQIAQQNEELARREQERLRSDGDRQRDVLDRQIAQLLGRQRAGLASSGVDLGFGSPLQVQTDTAALGALDRVALDEDIERAVYNAGLDAHSASQRGQLYQSAADNISPGVEGFSTFLGGASQFADQAYTYREPLRDIFAPTTTPSPLARPTARRSGSLQGVFR